MTISQPAIPPQSQETVTVAEPYLKAPLIAETVITKDPVRRTNKFVYGNCTYYVANKVDIPWSGNAGTWIDHAKEFDYKISNIPQTGAILVSKESPVGHVAFVERVNESDQTFTISEMNYTGFNKISYRTLPLDYKLVKGYIYTD